jgi:alkanesulfonate monooxygenase SsuD/methylene tetrahydromethanopterin reductase-like flavin-dependent oxidoreductase (luciferase family)
LFCPDCAGGVEIVGSPATVMARLTPLLEQSQADELMILTMVHDHAARLHSYDLLADAFNVEPVGAAGVPAV